jgi:subtilisin family serine protease
MRLRKIILAAALSLPLAVLNPAALAVHSAGKVSPATIEPVTFQNEIELIIVYDEDAKSSRTEQIGIKYDFTSAESVDLPDSRLVELITVKPDASFEASGVMLSENAEKIAEKIEAEPDVLHVQPNYLYRLSYETTPELSTLPDDTFLSEQWGLINSGQLVNGASGTAGVDINILQAWEITSGAGDVPVAVIDSGVWLEHPDLYKNIWVNDKEIPDNALDDDNNGYIDDYYGWDFALDQPNQPAGPVVHTHGTHVAGIISAAANNGSGISGVAPAVKIMSLNFMRRTQDGVTGSTIDAIKAINYARDNGAKIINASWGGSNDDPLLKQAIAGCGMAFVTAAGNSRLNIDVTPEYPAAYDLDNVITVAAVNSNGLLASFSNYGANGVDIAAPGSNILSTVSAGSDFTYEDNGYYAFMNGTSMAAPFVSGIAALQLSAEPDLSADYLRMSLIRTARPLAGLTGKMVSTGMADAGAALNLAVKGTFLFSVRFQDWNGNLLDEQIVDYGSAAAEPPDPFRVGHTFTGWDGSNLNIVENKVLTAQYKINYYNVRFLDWDGSLIKAQEVPYLGDAKAPANPVRPGYIFSGWDQAFSSITKNIEVKALYEESELMIRSGSVLSIDSENSFITGITAGMTVKQLLGQLVNTPALVSVLSSDGKTITDTSAALSTGMQLRLKTDKASDLKTLVIRGDTNGDGQISALDLLQMKKHLLRQSKLQSAYKEAGKITGQADLSALDLLQLKKHLLGQLKIR